MNQSESREKDNEALVAQIQEKLFSLAAIADNERALNDAWVEIHALLKQLFRNKISVVQAGIILEAALDCDYPPTQHQLAVGEYLAAVEAVVNGQKVTIDPRKPGTINVKPEHEGHVTEFESLMLSTKKKFLFSALKKKIKQMKLEQEIKGDDIVRVLHALCDAEENGSDALVSRLIQEVYELSTEGGRQAIRGYIQDQYDGLNLRGILKKALANYQFEGKYPFWWLQENHATGEAGKAAKASAVRHAPDKVGDRILRKGR
ncbi:hypothetical protein GW756_03855 [bacterium]|nr:hypothetical protein [bacterium]NCS96478.1 hypothetical protein [bacterium]